MQEETLAEFKEWIVESKIAQIELYDDYDCLRFCRARKFKMDDIKIMFTNYLKFREDDGVDTIIEDFHFHEADIIAKLYPCGYHKVDKNGWSLYIERMGTVDVKKILEETTVERFTKHHIQSYELLMKLIFPALSEIKG